MEKIIIGNRTCEGSKLTVVGKSEKRYKNGEIIWECKCDCGKTTFVKTSDIKRTRSCGCLKGRPKKVVKGSENF